MNLAPISDTQAGSNSRWLFALIFFLFLWVSGMAQPEYFNNAYDYKLEINNATTVIETDTGGYLFPSALFTPTYGALLIMKINKSGDTILTKSYPKQGFAYSTHASGSLIRTIDGKYFLCASILDTVNDRDALIVKFDGNGDTLWTKTYGGLAFDNANRCVQTSDSGYAMFGVTQSYGNGGSDFYLVKTDNAGNMEWFKTFGTAGEENAVSGQQTLDGGYILSGNKLNQHYIVKTDSAGNFQWDKLYSGTIGVCFVKQLPDSSYILTGAKFISGLGDQGCIRKVDQSGNQVWEKTYGTPVNDWFYSIPVILEDNSIVVAGQTINGSGIPIGWVLKANENGDSIWSRTYYKNSTIDNYFYDIKATQDNGFIMSGFTVINNADAWLVKVDSCGCEVPNCVPNCWPVGLEEQLKTSNKHINVYPNPTTGKFEVRSLELGVETIEIYDLFGRLVLRTNKEQIDMGSYPAGLYVWQVGAARGKLVLE